MAEGDLIQTGIAGLDDILRSSIPKGNVILVEGAAGTGKTLLGMEFIYRGVTQYNEPGLIVSFEVAPQKLIRDAARSRIPAAASAASSAPKISSPCIRRSPGGLAWDCTSSRKFSRRTGDRRRLRVWRARALPLFSPCHERWTRQERRGKTEHQFPSTALGALAGPIKPPRRRSCARVLCRLARHARSRH
jgi:KaiC